MQYDYEKFMEEHNLNKNLVLDPGFYGELDVFGMGYYDEEDQAEGYFKDKSQITVRVCDLKDSISDEDYILADGCKLDDNKKYYVVETHDNIDYLEGDRFIFDDYDEAIECAKSYQNIYLPSIEDEIEQFYKDYDINSFAVDIEPNRINNRSGNYVDYTIEVNSETVMENVVYLDEEIAAEIKSIQKLLDEGINGWEISNITSSRWHFDTTYSMTLSKGDYAEDVEVTLKGTQGLKHNLIDLLLDEVDFDQLEEECQLDKQVMNL